jgi:hypothetical protein
MRLLSILTILIMITLLVFSCKPKEMNIQDFSTIENEILKTDLTPASKEKILKKYGYTLKQYDDFDERVKKDPKLREDLGALRLKSSQGKSDIRKNIIEDIKK